jgi:hypothetical protein
MEYRKLKNEEIESLKNQGCSSGQWESILVAPGFQTKNIFDVHFFGEVRLGIFETDGKKPGVHRPGLYHSVIRDCHIHDNVRIADVRLISGYEVGHDAVIERVDEISMSGISAFGNGQKLDVLNEGGGRELAIFDRLSSQIAYLVVLYQHDQDLVKTLNGIIQEYTETRKSGTGKISINAVIRNASVIRNVWIGESAVIEGATLLSEGTIASTADDPVRVGEGVVARHFIIQSGSSVDSSAVLDKVFVGQGVRIGKQFSAENSVFFANCEGFHGEAVSLFAGPYTVTHHKSTLLIAALMSFYNAGSGTNQSNHMYKLGPLHQGILERGCKTGSFAYLLWPCRVGAFSVVMGKHGGNFDTSDFPFSYITVEDERSFLTPGMNLITVGTRRDVEKWPSRDRRKSADKLDLITFDWLNPMIVQSAAKASGILNELYEKTPKEQEAINYKGVRIKRLLLKSCRKYYDMLTPIFCGEQIVRRIRSGRPLGYGQTQKEIQSPWIDLGGMIIPLKERDKLMAELKDHKITSVKKLQEVMEVMHGKYDDWSWDWTMCWIAESEGKKPQEVGKPELKKRIDAWKENKIKLNNLILADARKEFDQASRIGFGMDGDEHSRDDDFTAVRGTYDGNKFVRSLISENAAIEALAEETTKKLS